MLRSTSRRLAATAAATLTLGLAAQTAPAQAAGILSDHVLASGENCSAPASWKLSSEGPKGGVLLFSDTGDASMRCEAHAGGLDKNVMLDNFRDVRFYSTTNITTGEDFFIWTGVVKNTGNIQSYVFASTDDHVATMQWTYAPDQAKAVGAIAESSIHTFLKTVPFVSENERPTVQPTATATKPAGTKASTNAPEPKASETKKPTRGVEAKTGAEDEVPVAPIALLGVAATGAAGVALRRKH